MGITKMFGIIWFLKTVLDVLVCVGYFRLHKKWKSNPDYEWLLGIGMGHLMMVFIIIFIYLFPNEYGVLSMPLVAVFLQIVLLMGDLSEKFFYNDTYFCLGLDALKNVKYEYQDIYSCSIGQSVCAIGVGNYVRELRKSKESEEFIKFAEKKYQEIYGKTVPPCKYTGKKDAFDGKLERQKSFLLNCRAVLLGGVCVIALLAGTISENFLHSENNTQYREAIILDCYERNTFVDKSIYFTVKHKRFEDKRLVLQIMPMENTDISLNKIYKAMWKRRTMYIYYDTAKRNNPHIVYDLRDDQGNVYFTFEESNRYFFERDIGIVLMLIMILGVGIGYYKYYIDTVKHPEKYSENVQKRVEHIVSKYKY